MSEGPGPNEVYCIECGEIIRERAEICPECGVRQPTNGPQQGRGQPRGNPGQMQQGQPPQGSQPGGGYGTQQPQRQAAGRQQDDIGVIYAHVDANKRKKTLRNLIDLALALFSVGFYLGLMIAEGFRHYYKLKNGTREPFDPNKHEKTWLV